MYLIVGLGNPGTQYEHTRHNVGFDVLTLLAQKLNVSISRRRGGALTGEALVNGEKVVLAKPQTYMNLSGNAVQELMHWYKTEPSHLMVIYDDIDLEPGFIRIRKDGSAGTHNGMRSIVGQIGTQAFPRIRVGVGAKRNGYDLADWVLSHYNTPEERQVAYDAYQLAADAALEYVHAGIESAMRKYNTPKPKAQKPEGSAAQRPVAQGSKGPQSEGTLPTEGAPQ